VSEGFHPVFLPAEAALDLKEPLSYIVPASGRASGFISARVKK
jgi:hypothetical protein